MEQDLQVVGTFYFGSNSADEAEKVLQLLRDNGYTLAKNDNYNYLVTIAPTEE